MKASCCFAGHSNLFGKSDILRDKLEANIQQLITENNVEEFYSGNMGDFDKLAESVVRSLKCRFKHIKLYKVIPYRTKEIERDREYYNLHFDNIIFPELDNPYYKSAITKRNQWMVDYCDYLICFVDKNHGGAFNTLKYAKKALNIKIINLA